MNQTKLIGIRSKLDESRRNASTLASLLCRRMATAAMQSEILVEILHRLTDREREVLAAFLTTPHDKGIARLLGACTKTIRNHILSIEHKLQVHSREELLGKVIVACFQDSARATR